nr:hypothetical protein [Tanacetum cinerariifolium]
MLKLPLEMSLLCTYNSYGGRLAKYLIPQRIEEDYYFIKDDIQLVSVYTTRDVRVRVMLILNAFLTEEIRATDDFKEYEMVFMNVAEVQENIAKVQEKLEEEEIEKMVEGDKDEESYASEFADSVLNDDVDDSGTRLEPENHKENPKKVDDDDVEIEKENKDDIKIEKEKKDDIEIEKEKKDDVEIEKEKKDEEIKKEQ